MQPHPPRYLNWKRIMCRIYETNKFHAVCSLHGEGLAEQLTFEDEQPFESTARSLYTPFSAHKLYTGSKYEHQR